MRNYIPDVTDICTYNRDERAIFKTRRERLTRYALACGYIEQDIVGYVETTLAMEHTHIYVVQYDFDQHRHTFKRTGFQSITKARRVFDLLHKRAESRWTK